MADQGAQAQQHNGTPARAGAPDLLPGPSAVAKAQARIRAGRANTLAALESGNLDTPPPVETKPEQVDTETEVDGTADDAGDDAGLEAKPAGAKPVETKVDAKKDPEAEKRLEAVQAAEKRSRDKITAERASLKADVEKFEKLQAEHAPRLEKLDKFEAAVKKLGTDPGAALAMLELGDDSALEAFARAAFAMTEAGKKDPAVAKAHAAKAAELMRSRETETTLEKMQREMKELRETISKQSEAQVQAQKTATYVQSIDAAAKASAPLVAHLLASDPDDTHDGLVKTYRALFEEHGEAPDAADVVAAFDKAQRTKFTKLGFDPESLIKNDTKKNIQAADKKHPAKTLGNDLSTPRVPRPTKSDKEHRAETLAMLESGKLE